jgi:hypothetical protein
MRGLFKVMGGLCLVFCVAAAARPLEGQGGHRLRLAYFVPKDRAATDGFEKKIRVVLSIVAELYKQDLTAKGYQPDGPRFDLANGQSVIHLIRGVREAG